MDLVVDNLSFWNQVADIDPAFTKPITGKDYRGTSPNPQYLIKLATEKLGPLGFGFGWEVVAEGFEHMGDTVLHWCRIRFWWRRPNSDDGMGSFQEYGQTKAAYVTSGGKHRVDEDAPKKSLTDAVTKSLARIGFAANIFLGRWDDSKYVAEVNEEFRAKEDAEAREKFEREVANKVAGFNEERDLEVLKATWVALNEMQPDVTRDPRVIAAKDEAKARIMERMKQEAA